jgi:hypothetical protein
MQRNLGISNIPKTVELIVSYPKEACQYCFVRANNVEGKSEGLLDFH